MTSPSLSYQDAGVDIDAGNALVDRIKPFAKRTMRPEVMGGIGGFGALFEMPKGYKEPVLVSGTDGVGTKLKLAIQWGRHDTIGIDLVAMSVNDVIVQGAEPLFFLDYFACGKLDVDTAAQVIQGVAAGCEMAGCALIGGETAEMPGMYPPGEYDLGGFAVGVVEKSKIITGNEINDGDVILGMASTGPHSNGYSLIRRVLSLIDMKPAPEINGRPLHDALIAPTRIYAKSVMALMKAVPVHGLAHITGGGLTENLPRILRKDLQAHINLSAWDWPDVFHWIQQTGRIQQDEMLRVFNCGIGMTAVVAPEDAERAIECLQDNGETVMVIGKIRNVPGGGRKVVYS